MSLTPRLDQIDTNYVINGDMYYWQRGTTGTVAKTITDGSIGVYVADRFVTAVNRNAVDMSVGVSQSTEVPNNQFVYSNRITSNNAHNLGATSSWISPLYTHLEGTTLANLKYDDTVYLSFWIKSNIAISNLNICLQAWSTTTQSYNTPVNIPANTWTYIKKTITLPNFAFRKDIGFGLRILIGTIAGSGSPYITSITNSWANGDFWAITTADNWASTAGNYIQITGVKLSKYAHDEFSLAGRNHLEELQLCQRYYEKSYNLNIAPGTINFGGHAAWSLAIGNHTTTVYFTVKKRVPPSIAFYSTNSGAIGYFFAEGVGDIVGNASHPGEGAVRFYPSSTTVSHYHAHWIADAEY